MISAKPLALAIAVLACVVGGCRGRSAATASPSPEGQPSPTPAASAAAAPVAAEPSSADTRPVVLFVGTSLTAGYGVDPDEAFPALVQKKIDAAGLPYRVVNAGVSGETSAGALRRIDWLLRQKVAVFVLETGANDGLRGQDPQATRDNIQKILDEVHRRQPQAKVVLVAMEALPNYGEEYRRRFRAIYPERAMKNAATFVPFLLAGVAGDPRLNQADGIHPNPAGHARVAENVWKVVRPLLETSAVHSAR